MNASAKTRKRALTLCLSALALGAVLAGCGEESATAPDTLHIPHEPPAGLAENMLQNGEKTSLQVRGDAISPAGKVDVYVDIDGSAQKFLGLEAGRLLQLGQVAKDAKVTLKVVNSGGAGTVRANILTDNCFRRTGTCSSAGCEAVASYTVLQKNCFNY